MAAHSGPLTNLTSLLNQKPELVGEKNEELSKASIQATKYLFDRALHTEKRVINIINGLLQELAPSRAPQTRSMAKSQSQMRSTQPISLQPTPLTSLHIEGMDEQQIWNQLELRTGNFCTALKSVFQGANVAADNEQQLIGEDGEEDFDSEEEEEDEDADEDGLSVFDDGSSLELEEEGEEDAEEEGQELDSEDEVSIEGVERMDALRDPSSDQEDEEDELLLRLDSAKFTKRKMSRLPRHPELDDGFFSLSEFNAETEEAEARSASKGRLASDSEDEELDEDVDLFTSLDQQGPAFDEGDLEEADSGHVYYNDFFNPIPKRKMPPASSREAAETLTPRKSKVKFHEEVRVKEIKAANRGRSAKEMKMPSLSQLFDESDDIDANEFDGETWSDEAEEGGYDDVLDQGNSTSDGDSTVGSADEPDRDAVERFKDDLFGEGDDEISQPDLSAHEARVTAIAKQIADLEAENVGEKEWTLKGEANSKKRPHNSLLEEDLDFEQVQRPVAAVTTERVASLEDLIKKRILENRFDDVERKRPMDEKAFLPSRYFELKDTKSQQSLAQIYENEYLAGKDGAVNEKDSKLQQEHGALEQLWERISGKLDALCNAHFVPKQPKATIQTISNVASASMETALPTSKTTATMMAPEEVFTPQTSDLRDRSELTPAGKRALRSKERKVRKRARDKLDTAVDKFARSRKKSKSASVKESKQAALKSVIKSGKGVTVVGNKLSSLDGKKKNKEVNVNAGSLKL